MCLIGLLGMKRGRVGGQSIPQLEQGSKRPWRVKVRSLAVLSVSGITFLDSPPGGAGGVGWGAGHARAAQRHAPPLPAARRIVSAMPGR